MNKIALISYQFAYNYGTCLQAYALWKSIDKLGYTSEYLNFGWKFPNEDCSYLIKTYYSIIKYLGAIKHKRLITTIEFDKLISTHRKAFENFRYTYIKESAPLKLSELSKVDSKYSRFIIGSDQTWNPDCVTEKYFLIFLLSFIKDKTRKFSYAPSIGKNSVDTKTENLFKTYLKDFQTISCRESRGCNILSNILQRKIEHVLDPTLLLTAAEWDNIATPFISPQKYVLCYILGEKEHICTFAQRLAKSKNLRLIILTHNVNIYKKYKSYTLKNIGPKEFVGLIKNSEYVVTDSFHGSIFSINYNKNFYSFLKRKGDENHSDNSRIYDVLKEFNLEDRFRKDDDFRESIDINYELVFPILNDKRKKSIQYLSSIINISI